MSFFGAAHDQRRIKCYDFYVNSNKESIQAILARFRGVAVNVADTVGDLRSPTFSSLSGFDNSLVDVMLDPVDPHTNAVRIYSSPSL